MNRLFIVAGSLSSMAALLHLACIYFGASWYRFFGAGEQMAQWAEQGLIKPTLITLFIFSVLSVWAAYAFSAAGLIRRLPLRRTALLLITAVYVVRGLGGFFLISTPMGRSPEFWLWSSGICLVIGLIHSFALIQTWPQLASPSSSQ
ncbi:hypothetical protein PULV_a2293 [Pseudoalteromonas ulvae UL12]|uniref:hypothetical protein n=1 Tax=Pseudoalteromonas ulvae TaxID=107327 RepID=UPI00186B96DE|nr:hypothetical protein [Pseudoalteromonas ulvae]MBE0364574.1 hypothetical protein [Pseudoalteromonas ulvae UL12]